MKRKIFELIFLIIYLRVPSSCLHFGNFLGEYQGSFVRCLSCHQAQSLLSVQIDLLPCHAHNLRKLIQKKLQIFPGVKKVIIDALIEPISDTKYRIVVVSTDNPEQFRKMLTKAPIFGK